MKKFAKIGLIVLLLAICIVTVVACNDGQNKLSISISDSNMPQTVFVKGNDLDLSAGKLIAVKGKNQTEIDLNADGVEVSGYDKNTVGSQTLTITYEGASTTLAITVVERITAMNHVSEYIAGEPFDNSGLLKITKDNGESFTVYIRDEKVTISGFDSSTAGDKTVNAKYKDGNTEFSGSFPITVYSADEIRFTAPTKRSYKSHDTEIDTAGGYFTVKHGTLTKNILLDKSKIKGFNPSAVNEENTSIKQTISVDYLGTSYTYQINLEFSDVTRIKNIAEELSVLNWAWTYIPEFTDEQGDRAIEAVQLFLGLSEDDALLITADELLSIVRPATVRGESVWTAEAEKYNTLFTISGNYLMLDCEKLDETKIAFEQISKLDKETDVLFVYGNLLAQIVYGFSRRTLYGKVLIGDYLETITDGETVAEAIEKVDLMLQMHEALKDIPADWDVKNFTSADIQSIEKAKDLAVKLGEIAQPIYERPIFNTVSEWRESGKNDYFEILYRYYYSLYKSDNEEIQKQGANAIGDLIDVCMPGILETFYLQYISTMLEQYGISYSQTSPASDIDTLGFVISYRRLVEIMDAILNGDDEMMKDLFTESELNRIVIEFQTSDFGMQQIFGGAYQNPEIEALWTKYINVITNLTEDNLKEFKGLFQAFIELTPELQAQFLASLNPYGSAEFSPSDGTERMTIFITGIFMYYQTVMPESLLLNGTENGIVLDLFDALQYYMFRYELVDDARPTYFQYMEEFIQTMAKVETAYKQLSGENKTIFDEHIGFFYERYLAIYKLYDVNGNFVVEDEIVEEWAEQIELLDNMYKLLSQLLITVMQDYTKYPVFVSAYEATVELYNDIMAQAPQEIKDMLVYSKTDVFSDMSASYETYLYQFRSWFISLMSGYPVSDEYTMMAWNEYSNSENLGKYMASLFEFYACAVANDGSMTLEHIKSAMAGFTALLDEEKALFVLMDGSGEFIYYKALRAFFAKEFAGSSSVLGLANELITLEIDWINTLANEQFVEAWESFVAKYEALSEEDKALFDGDLKEVYDYYKGVYDGIKEKLNTEQTPETQPEQE